MDHKLLIEWYESSAKPFLLKHAPSRVPSMDTDLQRLQNILHRKPGVTVCFLGNSGIGKSTLINALAAGDEQVLPAGGIGPLTAQATEVYYSKQRFFRVRYHQKGRLWRVTFGLENRLIATLKAQKKLRDQEAEERLARTEQDLGEELGADERESLQADSKPTPEFDAAPSETLADAFIQQARKIICDNQFATVSDEYLVDALRLACGKEQAWNQQIGPEDMARIERLKSIFSEGNKNRDYERRQTEDVGAFMRDLRAHTAGFLSPIIEYIEVGWPSTILNAGVRLVDLPGVGIANDTYRDVTKSYIREKARAVVLVVDKSGPTEASVELLRSSGFWDRLVGAADDPSSDPCTMLIAVTKVDDVAEEEWRSFIPSDDRPRPKKREVYASLVEAFKPRMRSQILEQLGNIGMATNEDLRVAREQARQTLLESLEIHPVSAIEHRKLLVEDEDDLPFLKDIDHAGVTGLEQTLMRLVEDELAATERQAETVATRLRDSALNELSTVKEQWSTLARAADEAARLESELAKVIEPLGKEYDRLVGGFRNYLQETVPTKIEKLVGDARESAQQEVNLYLQGLRSAHWATLRAAVRRGGSFFGSRHINLPDDISTRFQEPMAAIWGQKLLREIRSKSGDFADSSVQMVEEICDWAEKHGGATVSKKLLDNQRQAVAKVSEQMKQAGKEAVDELRAVVKNKLTEAIRKPIQNACNTFVAKGDDVGAGVKSRILDLFDALARSSTKSAEKPAIQILRDNFQTVRSEIQKAHADGGNPIEDTKDLIVSKHEDKIRRQDGKQRQAVIDEIEVIVALAPS